MSQPQIRSPWLDERVKVALLKARASHIQVLECPQCLNWNFYGGGEEFSCNVAGCGWRCQGERLTALLRHCRYRTLSYFQPPGPGNLLFPA